MPTETVALPNLGGDVREGVVVDLVLKPGDSVAGGETLLVVEADKVDVDVPAPRGGVLKEYLVAVDDSVTVGSPVCVLEVEA